MPNQPTKPKSAREKTAQEFRERYCRAINLRAAEPSQDNPDDEYVHLEGKAVAFDEETVLFKIGGVEYKEVISRGAFDEADVSDVVLKYNHNDAFLGIARTRNGSLNLEVRDDGVYVHAKIRKDNPNGMQFYRNVSEGLIDKMSFAFTIREESYDEEEHRWTVMKIEKVYDVAGVDFPAYDNTEIYAKRTRDLEELRAEADARKKAAEEEELKRRKAIVLGLLKN